MEDELTPKQIVTELDKYIIGQDQAKKAVAIALRNRWRRQQVTNELKDEILPNNIIMIGPTGVGKTEIARRLAFLAHAPFIKVEASKFTEVGYVGRDVESMVRDLTDLAVNMVKKEMGEKHRKKAEELVEKRILDILIPPPPGKAQISTGSGTAEVPVAEDESWKRTREKMAELLAKGEMDDRIIEIDIPQNRFPIVEVFSPMGMEEMGINLQEMFSGMGPQKRKRKKLSVEDARKVLVQEEIARLLDMDEVVELAKFRVENSGIIFIDELDKIASSEAATSSPDVSREGVQRDILPIVEGSNVMTKHGMIRTDHILFIAAGAFHATKPSDLIPELQGRFPIRVELDSLSKDEFIRILTEPKNALVKQYIALMETEGVDLSFDDAAIEEVAEIADTVNSRSENIGARRLQTVMNNLLEEEMFDLPEGGARKIEITKDKVTERLAEIVEDEDLSKYIL
ncbi:MAG: ATP-dependent protease ATPase subunit HslU [candidate division Zixibacteria bacterium]|nr:ATP-dependent protease ATPase subunit HslU [candidate division Zixibacteria bacterium]NIX56908.1 ATP-dependent protease ATPase subunit HslU [candidate division Zixibacteria bacterium]